MTVLFGGEEAEEGRLPPPLFSLLQTIQAVIPRDDPWKMGHNAVITGIRSIFLQNRYHHYVARFQGSRFFY
jgi:hypothetical protein